MCFWIFIAFYELTLLLSWSGVVALFILPSSTGEDRILDWKNLPNANFPWGILILFGGGLLCARRISK